MSDPNPIGFDEWQPDKSDRANPTAEAKGVYSVAGQYAPFPDIQTYGPPSDIDSYTKVLLHLDGPDAATTFDDAAANHVWTRTGTAQIDTADSKFGGASMLLAAGDYISTPNAADTMLGSGDWTVDCWFKCNLAHDALAHHALFGKATGFTGATDRGWFVYRNQATDCIRVEVSNGTTFVTAEGVTPFTNTLNTGWHHLALLRTGSTVKLYIDGLLEASVGFTGTVNEPSVLAVGTTGAGAIATWVGWIDEFRVSVGINRYPSVSDPDSLTKILLHMNGADTATTFPDHYDHSVVITPWTANGNVQIDTADSKFGGASGLFDGNSDYLSTPDSSTFTFGTSDLTIDFWFKNTGVSGGFRVLTGQRSTVNAIDTSIIMYRNPTNQIQATICIGAAGFTVQGTTQFTDTINTGWHHCALTRLGTTVRLFIDGLLEAIGTPITGAVNDIAGAIWSVGTISAESGASTWQGWLDEYRLSVGVDRFSASADMPDSFTKVLLHMNRGAGLATIADHYGNSGVPRAWTANGDAKLDAADSKFGNASLLLDGTGDYISTPDSTDFTLGSGDFTIDCWFKCTATAGSFALIAGQGSNTGSNLERAWMIYRTNANVISFDFWIGNAQFSNPGTTQFTDTINTGWHHVAAVRSGTSFRMYIDGRLEASGGAVGSVQDSPVGLYIGSAGELGGGSAFNPLWTGRIDEFRLSVGVARWTSNFTPPAAAYNPGFTPPAAAYNQGFATSLRTTAYSYGGGAANVVLGADTFYDNDTAPHIFFGDANRLYRLESRQAVDLSKVGFYSVGDSDTWQFCQFGNNVIGVSANVDPQHYIMGTSTDFGNLAGSPPHGATSVARVSEFVWLGKDFTVYWSAFGDCTDWVPDPVTQAGNQELDQERGEIMCLIGLDYAAIFQERAIRRAIYVGPPVIWAFGQDYVEKARGAVARNAAVAWGRIIFYASDDGFYAFDGQSSTPIGYGKVDNYFTSNLNYAFRHKISCGIDYARKIVVWGFPTGSAQLISELLIYSIQDGRWTHDVLPLEFLFDTPAEPFTVDTFNLLFPANNLDGAVAPNDIDSASFDDRRIRLAGFQVNSHALGLFTGAPRAATIDTKEFEAMPGKRALLTEVWPLGDYQQGAISASVGHRHALPGAAIDFTNATQMNRAGYCPQRIDARFLRVRQQITAGATWRRAGGVHYTATPTGGR